MFSRRELREKMESDSITDIEYGFMHGYNNAFKRKRKED